MVGEWVWTIARIVSLCLYLQIYSAIHEYLHFKVHFPLACRFICSNASFIRQNITYLLCFHVAFVNPLTIRRSMYAYAWSDPNFPLIIFHRDISTGSCGELAFVKHLHTDCHLFSRTHYGPAITRDIFHRSTKTSVIVGEILNTIEQ